MFYRSHGSWSHMEVKSPEVAIRFALCSSAAQMGADLPLTQIMQTMVCAVSLLMPNSSAIKLIVNRRSCASICRTFSIISGALPLDGRPNVAHPQSFPSFRESVWTICKHIFCSRLPSPAPIFHASPLQFSPICRRT